MNDWMSGSHGLRKIMKQIEKAKQKPVKVVMSTKDLKGTGVELDCVASIDQVLNRPFAGAGSLNFPVGSGIPNAYPIAVNTPLDRASSMLDYPREFSILGFTVSILQVQPRPLRPEDQAG